MSSSSTPETPKIIVVSEGVTTPASPAPQPKNVEVVDPPQQPEPESKAEDDSDGLLGFSLQRSIAGVTPAWLTAQVATKIAVGLTLAGAAWLGAKHCPAVKRLIPSWNATQKASRRAKST